ncbi:MAG: nitroreductase [Hyphomicrobiaceae bacterium]|jgi:nitroreductase
MQKPADTNFPIHDVIANRWSPRAFRADPVSTEQLGALFEAARWGASCFNAQPWHYLAATSSDTEAYAKLAACLVDGNAAWATKAPVLAIAIAELAFTHNGKPNRWAHYDTGNATANLTLQAEAMGLVVHQMGGFHADKVHGLCKVPDGYDPIAALAIGFPAEPDTLAGDLAERERAPRERKALDSFVFGAEWQTPHPFA